MSNAHLAFLAPYLPLIIAFAVAELVLKGFALWYAARAGQKWWFVILLVINTACILEIVYLLFIRPGAPYASNKNNELPLH